MLNKAIILGCIFFFLLSSEMKGQHSDCSTPLLLTDTIYIAKNVKGFGKKREFLGNDLSNKLTFEKEENTIWYLIKIPASGKFTFDIIAKDENDDWDFLLYENKTFFCKRIDSNKIKPIRSNLSRSATTGLSLTATQNYSSAGINNNYSKYLNVKKGEEYVLVVNNPKKSNASHKLVLHFPKKVTISEQQEELVESLKPRSNLKKFTIEIKDKVTREYVPANISVVGLKKESVELNDVTVYETEVAKQNLYVNIIAHAKGYMLTSVDCRLLKKKSIEKEVLYLEKIKEGKKVNLKNIQFYGERADFLPTATNSLEALLMFVNQNPTIKIEIEGHVNGPDRPNTSSFKKLSFARALAVKQYLVNSGISSERIQYIGYGNSKMLYPHPMKESEHSANRRVEVKIISK